jgi:DNA-binding response OmpR family regulator
MQPELFAKHDSRTLLVDADIAHAGQLVEQLNHAGFKTDFAVSWGAARTALKANYYHSCIVAADPEQLKDREQLDELRRAAPRVWMIVLSDHPSERAQRIVHRQSLAAVSAFFNARSHLAPCCVLAALRARPTY